ncbi:MAG: T9SS type A sorting domain-containing protein [Bacteroidia bacterium]|nr:T9SS type A sorting domain-containing protein [Bacteroidia bacterium]
MGGVNGEFSVAFTPTADNKWHSKEISMSEFINAGLELGTSTNNLIFSIVSENVIKTNATINVDDIYYYKTNVLPISITGVDIVDLNPLSVYQPNPDLLCINGTSNGSQIELIHMNGISMIKTEATEGTSYLSINSMPSGLYLLRIDSKVIKVLIK